MSEPLVIERIIDAPVARVWQAWTDCAELQQWWGPHGVTNPTCEWEARPGGKINIVMLAGEELGPMKGQEWPMSGEFKEVEAQQKLVFTSSPLQDGRPIMETRCTVTFEAQGNQTKLSILIEVISKTPAAEGPLSGMAQGWNQQVDKLAASLKED